MNEGQIIPVKFMAILETNPSKDRMRVQDFKLFLSRQC
jgi:hypothetical protein